ncbi:ankyrin repeat-containing domain protein, partial [Microdochium bolleyi]
MSSKFDPNSKDHADRTPLSHCAISGYGDGFDLILKYTSPDLLDWPDKDGRTPLFYAAAHPDGSRVTALLSSHPGIDVNRLDNYGSTPLIYAIEIGYLGT